MPGALRVFHVHWGLRQFLSPTIHWGHLSFTTAKAIDIVWDLLVGRVGQFLIAFYTYPVLKRTVLHRLETNSISLSLYSSLSIDRVSPWLI